MNQTIQRPRAVILKRLVRLRILRCLAFYLFICAGMAIAQRSLVYFPPAFTSQQVDEMARSANLERWTNASGEFIGLKRLSPRQPAKGMVLIMYGNAGCSASCAHYAKAIQSVTNFDVFILEYPGYADRSGSPTQTSLFLAADEAFGLCDTNKPIYLLGESLGTGVASYLAGTYSNQVAGVILLSPFNRLSDVALHLYPQLSVLVLLLDQFPSEDYLRNYHGPVGMVVDGRDTVVPEKFGLQLYNSYTGPKKLWEFPQGKHIEITEPPARFWKEVVEFWQTNRLSSPSHL